MNQKLFSSYTLMFVQYYYYYDDVLQSQHDMC